MKMQIEKFSRSSYVGHTDKYTVLAEVLKKPSQKGIDRGRVVALLVLNQSDGKIIAKYDHGWKERADTSHEDMIRQLVLELERQV